MFSVFRSMRKAFLTLTGLLALALLAACGDVAFDGPSINTSKPVPVALLVPSGSENESDARLAQDLENAARLAMADLEGVTIDLRVYPTAGRADMASVSAIQAVNEGAKIILGPVFADAANAAGQAISGRNVNLLAFSNNTGIAGGNVFVLGLTFENTANRLMSFARANGKTNLAIAHGSDGAETLGKDVILEAATFNGIQVSSVTPFELSQQGVINAIPAISDAVRTSGADTLFLTSGTAGALPFLAQLLPENGISSETVQFIGLQRWDIPQSALTLPGVQGGWFAKPDPALAENFVGRYSAAYGDVPHPISGLAYDGIAAIGALVSQGNADALTRQSLTQASGFIGVNGVFRLLADGTNERGLAVAQIIDNQVVIIDPAPRSFAIGGF